MHVSRRQTKAQPAHDKLDIDSPKRVLEGRAAWGPWRSIRGGRPSDPRGTTSPASTRWEIGLEMRRFYAALGNTLVASVINNFVWFAVTFWVFLQTRSVVATSIMAGVFTLTIALSEFFLGSIVDRYPKKTAMMLSSFVSTILYCLAALVYIFAPAGRMADPADLGHLWAFIVLTWSGQWRETYTASPARRWSR